MSDSYFILTKHMESYTIGPSIVQRHYVYEWLDSGKCFYVGMGINRRAWNTHNAQAEAQRKASHNFKVRIVQQFLNKSLAHAIERSLIKQRIRQGCLLTNERIPKC